MGIKEYLTGRKQKEVKYRLSDIVWVSNHWGQSSESMKSAINVPFIPNKDETKFKNLLTNEIVELPLVFKGSNPVASTLCKSVGLDYSNGGCGTMGSADAIRMALSVKGVSAKILRDYKAYETLDTFKKALAQEDTVDHYCAIAENFCVETSFTQCQLVDFANSLTKARNIKNAKENDERLKKAKEDAEYERNVRDF